MEEFSTRQHTKYCFEVPQHLGLERLDVLVAALVPGVSRSKAQKLIKMGLVQVDGNRRPQGFRPKAGVRVTVEIPEEPDAAPICQPDGLDILFEDEYLLAIAKRPGQVVHPGAGHRSGTIVDMLLASGRRLSSIGGPERAGLVHRLDKETSGVLLVAKDDKVHEALAQQFKDRKVGKAYLALVLGPKISDSGKFTTAYARKISDRRQFTSKARAGREAVTTFKSLLKGALCALVLAWPHTGRTHQIRVHLAEHGHPVVGDRIYGRAYPPPGSRPEAECQALREIERVALHAWALRFHHPATGDLRTVIAPVCSDFAKVCAKVFGEDWEQALPEDPFLDPLAQK